MVFLRQALDYTNKALRIRTKLLEEDHPDVASSYNNLGVVQLQKGKTLEALHTNERALKIRQKAYQNKLHPFLAESYCNKGTILGDLDKFTEALECYDKAVQIYVELYGEVNREIALNANNKACLYFRIGKDFEAFKNYIKSLKIYSKLNVRALCSGNVFGSMSLLFRNYDDVTGAQKLSIKAHQALQKSVGKEHRDSITINNDLQNIEQEQALNLVETDL